MLMVSNGFHRRVHVSDVGFNLCLVRHLDTTEITSSSYIPHIFQISQHFSTPRMSRMIRPMCLIKNISETVILPKYRCPPFEPSNTLFNTYITIAIDSGSSYFESYRLTDQGGTDRNTKEMRCMFVLFTVKSKFSEVFKILHQCIDKVLPCEL